MTDKQKNKDPVEEVDYVSRTAVKKHVEDLQKLGKRLTELRTDQQAQIPMTERLREAIAEMSRISANGAKRRHLQFIGKLMRTEDEAAIRQSLEQFDSASDAHNQRFHRLERLRESLVLEETAAFDEVLRDYPECDIQHLRALIRNAKKEKEKNKPPTSYRKIFQYLRELDEKP